MKYARMKRGRTETARWLWFGAAWDEGGYLKLVTWRGCYLAALQFSVGGDNQEVGLSLSLLWRTIALYLYLPMWRRRLPDWPRSTGTSLVWFREDDAFWDMPLSLDLWNDDSSYSFDDHKRWPWRGHGWHFYLHPLRWIVGDTQHQEDETSTITATAIVSMPEGSYPATFKASRVRWQRPRWFRAPWVWRCEIEVEGGIGVPGKGENSWDCGDDAIYSMSFPVTDEPMEPHEAAQRFGLDVLKRRQRYATLQWSPDKGWPAHCVRASA